MAVRMRDVAQAAGVSVATVSLALSGSARIRDETRTRVVDVAERLHYRPHAGARSLRTEVTGSLGLVVSDVANPFFAELAAQVQDSAAARGYSLVLCSSNEDAERQDRYLHSLLAESRVDGIMLVAAGGISPGIAVAAQAEAPLVFVDRSVRPSGVSGTARLDGCPVICSDAAQALDDAAALLRAAGHRRVGIIAPPLDTRVGIDRRDQMIASLTGAGVNLRDISVVAGDFRQDSGERAVLQLLASDPRLTAVFGADGLMTIGAMKGVRRTGRAIPQDLSLVGFDDAPWFELFDPPLTAIAQPVRALAAAAVDAMVALIDDPTQPVHVAAAPTCRLVVRASVGPAP